MSVTQGKTVSIEYTLKLDNDQVIDTNKGKDPLTFEIGASQIVPGLEKAIQEMEISEDKTVSVIPEEGYGEILQEAIVEVPLEQLPEELAQAGTQVQSQTQDGQVLQGKVQEVKDETAVIDFNHPLAGETLNFDVTILDVK
ncbi:MAG: peptidylprolyl isomerase [Thermodesulfobacteriota bacterium]|nr:peptidylprolyl isomerase [Thermodesulfobacteriota bacterium]